MAGRGRGSISSKRWRGLDILSCFSAGQPAHPQRGRHPRRPARPRAAVADPRTGLHPRWGTRFALTPRVARRWPMWVRSACGISLGRIWNAWSLLRASLVDISSTGPTSSTLPVSPFKLITCGSRSAHGSGRLPRRASTAGARSRQLAAVLAEQPLERRPASGRPRRLAASSRRFVPGVGTGRPGTGTGHPLGRRPIETEQARAGGDERHGARGRDGSKS